MTVTPVSAPSLTPCAGTAGSGSPAVGEEFAALVQQHLGDTSAADQPEPSDEDAEAVLQAAATCGVVVPDGVAAMLARLGGGAAVSTTAGTDVAAGIAAVPQASAAAVPQASAAAVVPGERLEGATTGPPTDTAGAAISLEGMQATTSTAASANCADSATTDASTAASTTRTDAPTVIATGARTRTTAAGEAAAQGPTTAAGSNPVADQVFPQVARLVSRGDGLHRLTLRLHPADLGEVKVVLTVKDNVVDVTMSADAAARDALRDGSPHLRSLLELAGASAGQLVVRELTPTGTSAAPPSAHQPGGHQPHDPTGDGSGSDSPGRSGRDPGYAAANGSQPDPQPTRRTNRASTSQLDLDL